MSLREELNSFVEQKSRLEREILEIQHREIGLIERKYALQTRIDKLILKVEPTVVCAPRGRGLKSRMSVIEKRIVSKIEEALAKDKSGLFSSEMEKILRL